MTRLLQTMVVLLALASAVPALAAESTTLQPTSEQKVIKDKDEYNAYMQALNLKEPAPRGAAMEAFAAKYPRSAVYPDALQQAMAAYQSMGNGAKVQELAERLLRHDPKNLQALAILTTLKMNVANTTSVNEGKAFAERGLKLMPGWKGAPGEPAAEVAASRKQMTAIFYGAIGLAALYAKDYPAARAALLKTVTAHINGFADLYRLGVAQLEMKPLDPQGFWYIAKSIDMAKRQDADAAGKIEPYASAIYQRYHGGLDGWDGLLAKAETENAPPRGFTVRPGK